MKLGKIKWKSNATLQDLLECVALLKQDYLMVQTVPKFSVDDTWTTYVAGWRNV